MNFSMNCVSDLTCLLYSHVASVAKCVFIAQTKCEKLFMAVEKRIESHYRWCIEKLVAEEVAVQAQCLHFIFVSVEINSIPMCTIYSIHTHTFARTCTISLCMYVYAMYTCAYGIFAGIMEREKERGRKGEGV